MGLHLSLIHISVNAVKEPIEEQRKAAKKKYSNLLKTFDKTCLLYTSFFHFLYLSTSWVIPSFRYFSGRFTLSHIFPTYLLPAG